MVSRLLCNGRVLTALVMLAIFVTMSLIALGFPEKARLMPLMVGVPGSLLGLVQLLLEIRTALAEQPQPSEKATAERREEGRMFLWMFLFFLGILCFGFVYAAPLLVFGFLFLGKDESLLTAAAGAVGTWVVLYGVFEQWFEIQLFAGLVIERLLG